MTILLRDADEKAHVVRFEFVRRQIFFERLFGLESFVESVAFGDQSVGVFCPRRSAREAKYRNKQPESAKEMIRIHEGKLSPTTPLPRGTTWANPPRTQSVTNLHEEDIS